MALDLVHLTKYRYGTWLSVSELLLSYNLINILGLNETHVHGLLLTSYILRSDKSLASVESGADLARQSSKTIIPSPFPSSPSLSPFSLPFPIPSPAYFPLPFPSLPSPALRSRPPKCS